MQAVEIWINCPDRQTALAIAEHIVGARLAACANIPGEIESLYRWKGAVERETEVTLLLKTRASLFDRVAAEARALHPYETPCIIATPIVAAVPDYAAWIEAETAAAADGGQERRPRDGG